MLLLGVFVQAVHDFVNGVGKHDLHYRRRPKVKLHEAHEVDMPPQQQ